MPSVFETLLDVFLPGARQVGQALVDVFSGAGGPVQAAQLEPTMGFGAGTPVYDPSSMGVQFDGVGQLGSGSSFESANLGQSYAPASTSLTRIGAGDLPVGLGIGGTALPKTLVQWIKRVLVIYGPVAAKAVFNEIMKRRASGQSIDTAIDAVEGKFPRLRGTRVMSGRRRRMNPTNIRALRRAMRRVRGARRTMRKVRGLFPARAHVSHGGYRRPRRRGDLWTVENYADQYDEAEDLGYDPDFLGDEGEDE